MKRAIIYGGAFNPPTNAHRAILKACVSYASKSSSEVWVMPSGNRSDKTISTPLDKRMSLVEALIESVDCNGDYVRAEDFELRLAKPTQTFETYTSLQQRYPDFQQVWVFGSDSILTMKQWENGAVLFNTLDMLIVERPGCKLNEMPPRGKFLTVETFDVSSTMVREHMHGDKDFSHLVPPEVHRILS